MNIRKVKCKPGLIEIISAEKHEGHDEKETIYKSVEKPTPIRRQMTMTQSIPSTATGLMDISLIKVPESGNHRQYFTEEGMKELEQNIKQHGVLEPILLRPDGGDLKDKKFLLIAGERRLRAAKAAGLKQIPARIMDVTEDVAHEIQVAENLQRQNLGPIEEAVAFKRLHERLQSPAAVAATLDKSVPYVVRALSLLELPEPVKVMIETGELTAAHGHQLARVPEKNREALIRFATTRNEWSKQYPSVDDLKNVIEQKVEHDLKTALFPKETEYAGLMACGICPHNTGNQGVLFDGAVSGKCTNPACFNRKTSAALQDFADKAQKRFPGFKVMGMISHPGYMDLKDVKGHPILPDDVLMNNVVKKAMLETPEKFGIVVVKPSKWSSAKPTTAIVCLDDAILPKGVIKIDPLRDYGQNQQTEEEIKRNRFINGYIQKELLRAVASKINPSKIDKKTWTHIAFNSARMGGDVKFILNIVDGNIKEDEDIETAIKKLDQDVLVRFVVLSSFNLWDDLEGQLKIFGVDAKKMAKPLQKEAEKAWLETMKVEEKK